MSLHCIQLPQAFSIGLVYPHIFYSNEHLSFPKFNAEVSLNHMQDNLSELRQSFSSLSLPITIGFEMSWCPLY